MATYAQIQGWVKTRYGFTSKTCWIAHCKEIYGLDRHDAPNRLGLERVAPCPPGKQEAIKTAFRHFGML